MNHILETMEEIRNDMIKVFDLMLDKFPAIGIRYEYNQEYSCFLVSIDVDALNTEKSDRFSESYLSNVKTLEEKYGDDSPLFCIDEEWFSLSKDAISYNISKEEDLGLEVEWIDDILHTSKIDIKSQSYHKKGIEISTYDLLLAA